MVARIRYTWVKGHQEGEEREVVVNNRADRLAGAGHGVEVMKDVQLPGETVGLWHQGRKICKKVPETVRRVATTPDYQQFMCEKLGWSSEQWDNIDWKSYRLGRRSLRRHERHNLTKLTIGWVMDPRRSQLFEQTDGGVCGWCQETQAEKYHVFCCAAGRTNRLRLWYGVRERLEQRGSGGELMDKWEDMVQDGARDETGTVATVIFGFVPKQVVQDQMVTTSNEHWGTIATREWMKWALAVWYEYVEAMHAEEGAREVRLDQNISAAYQRIERDATWKRECGERLNVILKLDVVAKQQWLDYWTARFKRGGKRQVTLMQLFRGA
jgi:hypothetical protein